MKRRFRVPMILILSVALTLFFQGCVTGETTTPADQLQVYDSLALPTEPYLLPVEFVDTARNTPPGYGLWLSYDDYRNLETNILRMRAYQMDLLDIIKLYRHVEDSDG